MATPMGASESRNISPILIIVGLLILIAGAWALSYQFTPREGGVIVNKNPHNDWLTQKAKECQGDFQKLSPEDQKLANEYTEGRGSMTMAMAWGGISRQEKK